jgi:hypothetical protein
MVYALVPHENVARIIVPQEPRSPCTYVPTIVSHWVLSTVSPESQCLHHLHSQVPPHPHVRQLTCLLEANGRDYSLLGNRSPIGCFYI